MAVKSAIILAGGCGTRIWPYNEVRNKCALPVANLPNIRRQADLLVELGVSRLVVVLGPHPGSIRAALLGSTAKIEFVDQPAGGGTAGAVVAAAQLLEDRQFLVVYGDTVTT